MSDLYIDNNARKRIVTKWIPISLGFLHVWGSALIVAACYGRANSTIDSMFGTCGLGIAALIFLLISNKAVDIIMSRFSILSPSTVEKTVTEKTVVTNSESAQNVDIKAENVNVSS